MHMPTGDIVNTNHIVRAVRVEIDGRSLETKLYVLNTDEFDGILGMD